MRPPELVVLVRGGGELVMVPGWWDHSPMASAANVGWDVELLVLVGTSFSPGLCEMCGVGAAWLSSAAREQGSGLCQVPGLFLQ